MVEKGDDLLTRELDILTIIRKQRQFTLQMIGLLSRKQIELTRQLSEKVIDPQTIDEQEKDDSEDSENSEIERK